MWRWLGRYCSHVVRGKGVVLTSKTGETGSTANDVRTQSEWHAVSEGQHPAASRHMKKIFNTD
jgi:hypothetical protein